MNKDMNGPKAWTGIFDQKKLNIFLGALVVTSVNDKALLGEFAGTVIIT
jgi:hypothetical protein